DRLRRYAEDAARKGLVALVNLMARHRRHQQEMQEFVDSSGQPAKRFVDHGGIEVTGGDAALIACALNNHHHLFAVEVGCHGCLP
ncbi:MAG TPA: hypothetical protein PKA47_02650, partial [Accumulibacter sp.]|uniref:hypothetical protein n=1 Tax=Accumulibacter sp. TaxID=2053492 RepID=UPI002C0B8F62